MIRYSLRVERTPVKKYNPKSGAGNPWHAARAQLRFRRGCWWLTVKNMHGDIVLKDNVGSGGFDRLMRQARQDTWAVRRMDGAGHVLKPYSEVNKFYDW